MNSSEQLPGALSLDLEGPPFLVCQALGSTSVPPREYRPRTALASVLSTPRYENSNRRHEGDAEDLKKQSAEVYARVLVLLGRSCRKNQVVTNRTGDSVGSGRVPWGKDHKQQDQCLE